MIPCIVIAGYLGAGKTTLINHLLRDAQREGGPRIAVLVNDFGELSIDAALIQSSDGEVMSLTGGCLCCSYGADLVSALCSVVSRAPAPDLILIECSGVALPAAVARTARLAPGIRVEGSVVLVDASRVHSLGADPFVGDLVQQQWREADLLLMNQCDRVTAAQLPLISALLQHVAPHAPRLQAVQARWPLAMLTDVRAGARPRPVAGLDAGARFVSCTVHVPRSADAQALRDCFADPAHGVVRAKGLWRDTHGRAWLLQAMGTRCEISHAATAPESGSLVVIGLRGHFDAARLTAAFHGLLASSPHHA